MAQSIRITIKVYSCNYIKLNTHNERSRYVEILCVCFFHALKITTRISEAFFMQLYIPHRRCVPAGYQGKPPLTRWFFVTRKPYLTYHVTGISQAAEVDLQKTDRVIIIAKQLRRIIREQGCVWANKGSRERLHRMANCELDNLPSYNNFLKYSGISPSV